jgi:hypothetical protein
MAFICSVYDRAIRSFYGSCDGRSSRFANISSAAKSVSDKAAPRWNSPESNFAAQTTTESQPSEE